MNDAVIFPDDRVGEAAQVLEDVELALAGKAQRRTGLERRDRRAIHERYVGEPDSLRGFGFLHQLFGMSGFARQQVAVQPLEVAVDTLERDDLLDAIDRGAVTLDGEAGALRSVHLLEPVDAVIHRVGEVRGRARGLAVANGSVIQNHHALALAREMVRDGQAGDSSSYDADVNLGVLRELG